MSKPYQILSVTVEHVPPGYIKSAEAEAKEDFASARRDYEDNTLPRQSPR